LEFVKIPSQRKKIKEILGFGEEKEESSEDAPIILQTTDRGCSNGKNDPFYISFQC
jgi:hypothetical protein